MKILIADDNEDILDTTKMVLEMDDHEVHIVSRGSWVLKAVRDLRPELVIQDVRMPGLELLETLEAIYGDGDRSVRVLLFSGHRPGPELLDHPAVIGFLGKPFDIADLRERVSSLSSS